VVGDPLDLRLHGYLSFTRGKPSSIVANPRLNYH
jgi:hypothetical protein